MNLLAEYRYDGIYHMEFEFKNKKYFTFIWRKKPWQ